MHSIAPRLLLTFILLLPGRVLLAAPQLQLDPPVLELGSMQQNAVLKRDVMVRNTGDETLEIYELSTTCPCTYPELIDESIAPGQTGLIHVTFQSKTYQGELNKLVEIYSNDPAHPEAAISVRVFIEAPVFVDPDTRRLGFGDVDFGATPTRQAVFRPGGAEDLEITVLEFNADLFDCRVEEDQDGHSRLEVGLKGTASVGPFREIVSVGTSALGAPRIDLEVFGNIKAEITAEPVRINFRSVAPAAALSRDLVLTSSGAAFRVTAAEVDLPGLRVEIITDKSGHEVRLRLAGNALAADDEVARKARGRLKGRLTIETDHPAQPRLEVVVLYRLRI